MIGNGLKMKEKFIKIIMGLIVLVILTFSVLNKIQLQKCNGSS